MNFTCIPTALMILIYEFSAISACLQLCCCSRDLHGRLGPSSSGVQSLRMAASANIRPSLVRCLCNTSVPRYLWPYTTINPPRYWTAETHLLARVVHVAGHFPWSSNGNGGCAINEQYVEFVSPWERKMHRMVVQRMQKAITTICNNEACYYVGSPIWQRFDALESLVGAADRTVRLLLATEFGTSIRNHYETPLILNEFPMELILQQTAREHSVAGRCGYMLCDPNCMALELTPFEKPWTEPYRKQLCATSDNERLRLTPCLDTAWTFATGIFQYLPVAHAYGGRPTYGGIPLVSHQLQTPLHQAWQTMLLPILSSENAKLFCTIVDTRATFPTGLAIALNGDEWPTQLLGESLPLLSTIFALGIIGMPVPVPGTDDEVQYRDSQRSWTISAMRLFAATAPGLLAIEKGYLSATFTHLGWPVNDCCGAAQWGSVDVPAPEDITFLHSPTGRAAMCRLRLQYREGKFSNPCHECHGRSISFFELMHFVTDPQILICKMPMEHPLPTMHCTAWCQLATQAFVDVVTNLFHNIDDVKL